jgi:Glycosyltransferase
MEEAAIHGVRLEGVAKSDLFREEMFKLAKMNMEKPGKVIFHLHSVFIPQHTWLGLSLRKNGIPYCVKPGGNLLPEELARKTIRKRVYMGLVENRFLGHAGCLIGVSRREQEDLQRHFPSQIVELLPNAVIPSPDPGEEAGGDKGPPRGFFLGKKDVFHKGIDRIFRVAREGGFLIDLFIIEHPQPKLNREFARLCEQGLPASVSIRPPVYGEEKQRVLQQYDYYLHASRWEVFGNSILEAMLAAKPVILARECDLAEYVEKGRLGIVVDFDAGDAAERIAKFLSDRGEMVAAGRRARDWALKHSSPGQVAARSLEIYERIFQRFQKES